MQTEFVVDEVVFLLRGDGGQITGQTVERHIVCSGLRSGPGNASSDLYRLVVMPVGRVIEGTTWRDADLQRHAGVGAQVGLQFLQSRVDVCQRACKGDAGRGAIGQAVVTNINVGNAGCIRQFDVTVRSLHDHVVGRGGSGRSAEHLGIAAVHRRPCTRRSRSDRGRIQGDSIGLAADVDRQCVRAAEADAITDLKADAGRAGAGSEFEFARVDVCFRNDLISCDGRPICSVCGVFQRATCPRRRGDDLHHYQRIAVGIAVVAEIVDRQCHGRGAGGAEVVVGGRRCQIARCQVVDRSGLVERDGEGVADAEAARNARLAVPGRDLEILASKGCCERGRAAQGARGFVEGQPAGEFAGITAGCAAADGVEDCA